MINQAAKNNPCFQALVNNVHKNTKTAEVIKSKLYEEYPLDEKGRSYVDRANHYNLDIHLYETTQGVQVDVVNRNTLKMTVADLMNSVITPVYTRPEDFDINKFREQYKQSEESEKYRRKDLFENGVILTVIVTILMSLFAFLIHNNELKSKLAENNIRTELVKK